MIYPPVYPAKSLGRFTPEQLADPKSTCICGRKVPLGAAMVVWTHAQDSEEYAYFECCSQQCFVTHISAGNA